MEAVVFITGSPLVNTALAFPPELVKKNSANRVSKNNRSPMLGVPRASLSACASIAAHSVKIENTTGKTVFIVNKGGCRLESMKGTGHWPIVAGPKTALMVMGFVIVMVSGDTL